MAARLGLAVSLLLVVGTPCTGVAQDRSFEYTVKAAFLYKFGSFIDWPAGAFPAVTTPMQLCVVGRDPFGAGLDAVVRGQTIDGRGIVVRRLPLISSASGCHIAYLGGSPEQSIAAAARALRGAPVLTVADETTAEPVAVQFVLRANRVRFQINLGPTRSSGLTVSSKLLNLAAGVTP